MCPDTTKSAVTAAEFSGQSERRHSSRTPTFFIALFLHGFRPDVDR